MVVVGAGHAGCEAALAAARLGAKTLLLTLNLDRIAWQPCNPAVGFSLSLLLLYRSFRLVWGVSTGFGHSTAAADGLPSSSCTWFLQRRMACRAPRPTCPAPAAPE